MLQAQSMNIANILKYKLLYLNKAALIYHDKPVSFKELQEKIFRLANGLAAAGIKPRDRVGIYLPNWPEYIYSYLALFCLGATVVPLDYMLTEEEMSACLNHCQANYLIAKPKNIKVLEKLRHGVSSIKDVIVLGDKQEGFLNFEELAAGAATGFQERPIANDEIALLMYTSGTTGRPKGIMLTYGQLSASTQATNYVIHWNESDVLASALPFSHVAGLMYPLICIVHGVTLILMERFMPLQFLKNVEQYKVTCFYLVPSMYYALLQLKEFEQFDLSSVRFINVFGAPNAPDVLRRFHQYCPHASFLNGWGLTETNGPIVVTPMGSERLESVGLPVPWIDVRIVDDNDRELPNGQAGEIAIKSWVVMKGYYNDEEETRRVMRNGWFHTGDVGKFDEQGYLYILGRKKEMIKVSGEIVYATEVESALARHPNIKEVAVIGAPDKLRGEVVKAVAVLKENMSLTEDEIRYFAREHLAHFKVPHIVEFRDSLPKTRSGKIDKTQLSNED